MESYYTETNFFDETSTLSSTPHNDKADIVPDDSFAFIFVPFAVLATLLVLSAMVRWIIMFLRKFVNNKNL